MERSHIQRDPDGKIRGADRKKYNQLSKEMNKLSKQIQASQKSTPTPTVTPKKSGGSSGILGLISSNVDEMVNRDKYKVGSKEPKNTVVAYEQEANKNQQKTAPASGGNEIPSFDVAPIRDPLKMVTLQIVLF